MSDTTTPRTSALDRAYAQALFEMAEQARTLEELADEVDQLNELISERPELRSLLNNRLLSDEARSQMLQRLFEGKLSDTLYRFVAVIDRKGRLPALPAILQAFVNLVMEHKGLVEVDVFVPTRLEETYAGEVASRIGQALKREVVLHQYVDESLIGGLKIRVGDRVLDGSVATQLRTLRERMIRRGREAARGQGGEE